MGRAKDREEQVIYSPQPSHAGLVALPIARRNKIGEPGRGVKMDIEKVVAAFGEDNFSDVLSDELSLSFERLPLETACEHGGFPDPEWFEIKVIESSADEKAIQAKVTISFTENCNTGCGDVVVPHSHLLECNVTIPKEGADWEIEPIQSSEEYEPEF
jgi:hypothetical protein